MGWTEDTEDTEDTSMTPSRLKSTPSSPETLTLLPSHQPLPQRAQRSNYAQYSKGPERVTKTVRVQAPPLTEQRKTSKPPKLQQVTDPERYCAVVDHVTAVLARIAAQPVESSYWRTIVIAVLTMLSTKLKVVAIDLPTNVRKCLDRCKKVDSYVTDRDGSNTRLGEWQFPRISDSDGAISRHCLEYAFVGRWLTNCLTQALVELGAKRPVHVPRDRIDACAMVFRSGTDSLTTLMHQDRHGNIGGLCDALPLVFSGAAISLVMDLGLEMERLEREKTERSVAAPPPPPGASRRSAALEASQEFMLDNCGFKHLTKVSTRLADIASLVTVLVPLSLANSSLAEEFKRTLQALSALSAFGEAVPTATNFTALVHLSSEGSAGNGRQGAVGTDRAQQKRRSSREKPVWLPSVDVTALAAAKSLSQSTLAKRRHDLFNPDSKDLPLSKPENSVRETMTAAKERLNDLNRKTEHWAIDGGAVIVKCPVYVWSTVAVCGILVLGGFMIGFFVGERIPGVDPFGIASFTWVLAGFIILIAKSVRVSEWSWRDFLLGRVTCRSVTELHTVTRLDAQDIIMYLLSTRHRNLLGTCGPFNTPFREKNPGGFSIDVKIELQTLWACGIIPLQVTTLEGPNLVLLDLTRGQKGLMKADHSTEGYAENDNYIAVCRDLPPADDGRDAPLVLFESVSWIKIVGIYDCLERKFR